MTDVYLTLPSGVSVSQRVAHSLAHWQRLGWTVSAARAIDPDADRHRLPPRFVRQREGFLITATGGTYLTHGPVTLQVLVDAAGKFLHGRTWCSGVDFGPDRALAHLDRDAETYGPQERERREAARAERDARERAEQIELVRAAGEAARSEYVERRKAVSRVLLDAFGPVYDGAPLAVMVQRAVDALADGGLLALPSLTAPRLMGRVYLTDDEAQAVFDGRDLPVEVGA